MPQNLLRRAAPQYYECTQVKTHLKDSFVLRNPVNSQFQSLDRNLPRQWILHSCSLCCSDFASADLLTYHPSLPHNFHECKEHPNETGWPHLSFWQWGNWVQPIVSSILSSSGKGSPPQRWRNKESLLQSDRSLQMKTSPRPPTLQTWVPSHPTGDVGKRRKTGTALLTFNRWMDLRVPAILKISVLIWSPYYSTRKKQSAVWDGRSRK